jgi:hypothetical protein
LSAKKFASPSEGAAEEDVGKIPPRRSQSVVPLLVQSKPLKKFYFPYQKKKSGSQKKNHKENFASCVTSMSTLRRGVC